MKGYQASTGQSSANCNRAAAVNPARVDPGIVLATCLVRNSNNNATTIIGVYVCHESDSGRKNRTFPLRHRNKATCLGIPLPAVPLTINARMKRDSRGADVVETVAVEIVRAISFVPNRTRSRNKHVSSLVGERPT